MLWQRSRVVLWHIGLNFVTHVIDYGGTVVNYMVAVGLGCIVALYHHSSTSYQIH